MNYEKVSNKRQGFQLDARMIAQIGVLGGIAFLLMMFEFPLWFAPGFYQLDFSEIPVLIGGFAMGPVAGILIELIKVTLYMLIHGSSTAGVGDLANFLIGCSLVVPAAVIYKTHKSRTQCNYWPCGGNFVNGLCGKLDECLCSSPVYAAAFHMPMSALISAGSAVNPSITSLETFILLGCRAF
jgi:riboflavin transporter